MKCQRQTRMWAGEFGRSYTDRNALTLEGMEQRYRHAYGVSRSALNERFLSRLDRAARILEIGCNIGNQLLCLQKMGFSRLCGVELQSYAVQRATERTRDIDFVQASAAALPFGDRAFDVVLTSGVLIHIPPGEIPAVLHEIRRCTRRYIWGFEYFAEDLTEVEYRGEADVLWKGDYVRQFLELCSDLRSVRLEKVKYLASDDVDMMYLLSRQDEEKDALSLGQEANP